MIVRLAPFGHDRQPQKSLVLKRFQRLVVELIDLSPPFRDGVQEFELGIEKSATNLARNVAGADIDPGVFIHLTAEELPAVGPLVANNLGALDVLGRVDAKSA